MAQLTPLGQRALYLHNAAPTAFKDFLTELELRTTLITVAVTEAPQHEILVAQGRAQEARTLLRILQECHLPRQQKPIPQV